MIFRRRTEVPPMTVPVVDQSESLQRQLDRMVRRLETYTDQLILQTSLKRGEADEKQ